MTMKIPKLPWTQGRYDEYCIFEILVQVCAMTTEDNRSVLSVHTLNEESQELSRGLPSGGHEQIAFALLTEALRREAFLELLVLRQNNPDALDDDDESLEKKIQECVIKTLTPTIQNMVPAISKEILAMFRSNTGDPDVQA